MHPCCAWPMSAHELPLALQLPPPADCCCRLLPCPAVQTSSMRVVAGPAGMQQVQRGRPDVSRARGQGSEGDGGGLLLGRHQPPQLLVRLQRCRIHARLRGRVGGRRKQGWVAGRSGTVSGRGRQRAPAPCKPAQPAPSHRGRRGSTCLPRLPPKLLHVQEQLQLNHTPRVARGGCAAGQGGGGQRGRRVGGWTAHETQLPQTRAASRGACRPPCPVGTHRRRRRRQPAAAP